MTKTKLLSVEEIFIDTITEILENTGHDEDFSVWYEDYIKEPVKKITQEVESLQKKNGELEKNVYDLENDKCVKCKVSPLAQAVELKQLQEQNRWRDVNEELPEYSMPVAVFGLLGTGYDYACGSWEQNDDMIPGFCCRLDTITHWKPITPPKQKE